MSAAGGFAAGLAGGLSQGVRLGLAGKEAKIREKDEERRAEEFGLRKRVLTGQVQDQERERADREAIRLAGANAIETAMGVRVPAAPQQTVDAGDTAVATPYVDPASGAPAQQPQGATSTGLQPRSPAQPPNATPNEDDILTGLDASWKAALQRGRQDLGLEYFNNASALRANLRNRALDRADQQYHATGDFSVYVEPYNRYVMDGGRITGIQRTDDGKVSVGFESGGRTAQKVMSPQEAQKLILTMRDPAAMRRHELTLAQKLFEERIKVHTVREGGAAVTGGQVMDQGGVSMPKRDATKPKDNFLTVKGGKDEGETVYRITPNGTLERAEPGEAGGPGRRGAGGNPGKDNLSVHKEFMDLSEKEFGEWDPVSGKNVLKGPKLQQALNRASVATQVFEGSRTGGNPLDHVTAYNIAQNGEMVPDAVFKTNDGRFYTYPGVRYQGQVYGLGGHTPQDVTDRVKTAQAKKPANKPGDTPVEKAPTKPPAATPRDTAPERSTTTAGAPELVESAGLTRRSPKERAEASRASAAAARTDAQRGRLADAFRDMVKGGRYTVEDAPIIREAIASGKLTAKEIDTANEMLSRAETQTARK